MEASTLRAIGEDRSELKARGAFYTPERIAHHLTEWAIADRATARVLDPSCGEGVFLQAAGRILQGIGGGPSTPSEQLVGVDVDERSLAAALRLLSTEPLTSRLVRADFFRIPSPTGFLDSIGQFDAVVGNPPFIRYQQHSGAARRASVEAALRQGVRLSGLASSWAAVLVHASSFLKTDGRLAMVLPAELLTVGYAEPIRRWLRERFAAVSLVLFERLQFPDALENVILLLAQGSGGCDAFSLWQVRDADELERLRPGDELGVAPGASGKWTDLLLSNAQRRLFRHVVADHFVALASYGVPELGTVTGANSYFAVSEATRVAYGLSESLLTPISPPGTKHLRGLTFTENDWEELRQAGQPVWMLWPGPDAVGPALKGYLAEGERRGIPEAYKCRIRDPWWRPPRAEPPDLFFTYMSYRFPRLISNSAGVSFLNSMHGLRLRATTEKELGEALPLLALNSVTMLGAEVHGRSYGGGILKMEPSDAACLPVPGASALLGAWQILKPEAEALDWQLCNGRWADVVARVDEVLLGEVLTLTPGEIICLRTAATELRQRRLGRVRVGRGPE